jgi:hypothetical protein
LRHDRGEVTAGAVTADRYSRRVTAEFAHVRGCPLQRGGGVFGGGGPRVLRTESVGDGDDDGGDTAGQRAGHDVAGLEAARGPPAAVVPDDDGERVSVGARRSSPPPSGTSPATAAAEPLWPRSPLRLA